MSIETIASEVRKLKRKYKDCSPEQMCKSMGILINRVPMGKEDKDCKGFFVVVSRIPMIALNSDLPESKQRIILAHELGHAVLHRKYSELRALCSAREDRRSYQKYSARTALPRAAMHPPCDRTRHSRC